MHILDSLVKVWHEDLLALYEQENISLIQLFYSKFFINTLRGLIWGVLGAIFKSDLDRLEICVNVVSLNHDVAIDALHELDGVHKIFT